MPGYLPESDVWITRDWEAARDSLIEDLEHGISQDELNGPDTEAIEMAERCIVELRAHQPNTEYLGYVGLYAYWVNETDEEPEDDES
jgi:hypothetical protein